MRLRENKSIDNKEIEPQISEHQRPINCEKLFFIALNALVEFKIGISR